MSNQQVKLPTFEEIIREWDRYREENSLQWSDMWIFKADITGCFNQLYWDQHTTPLMGFMLDDDTLMLMLTCGFGVGVTPMIWRRNEPNREPPYTNQDIYVCR